MIDPQRRRVLRTLGIGTAALIGGVGTATARPPQGASAEKNLVETAIALNDSGQYAGAFDELIDAVVNTGLDATLSDEDEQFTVFAPIDDGFENVYAADNGIDDATDVPAGILLYHVTDGRRYSPSVVNASEIEMLNGGTVTVDDTTLNGGQAEIFVTNVEASNGLIHAIEPGNPGVLIP
ncbi:MAG: fasciclin domain-containing protein [Halovenus sp.]